MISLIIDEVSIVFINTFTIGCATQTALLAWNASFVLQREASRASHARAVVT